MKEYFNTYRLRSHDNLRFLVASNSSGLYSFHWDMVRLDYSLAPRAIRLLAEHGADALRPSLVNGRYLGPLISRRQAGDLRKRAIIRGTFGQFSYPAGGWDPAWDEEKKMFIMKPHKGHKRERDRESRAEKITNAMKGMPDRITKYHAEAVARRPKKDLNYMFDRIERIAKKRFGISGSAPTTFNRK